MRLLWLLGVSLFLVLIFWFVQAKEPYFWYSAHDFYERAQEAEDRGAKTEALEWARQAYRRQPGDPNYGAFLGWRYLETGQPQAALQIFRQVCEQHPQAAAAFKGQAQALEKLADRPAALALLDSFLASNPDNWEILQFAADLAGRQASTRPQALNYYRRLYKLNATDTAVRRQLLNLLLAAGNFAEAVPVQEAETADFPDDPAALHQLALLHYWQQDYEAAVPIYQRLLELEAENQAIRLEAAKNADAAHEVDKALSHYLRLYTQEPDKKEHALPLARLWSQKGNHTEAVTVLTALLKEHPDADLRRQCALEHLLAGDYHQSYRAYRAAWEAGDTHQETILNLARLAAQQRHFFVAAQFWDEARRRQLVRRDLSWEAALTYSYAQRYSDAVEVLKAADRQEPQVLLFLGQMHFYQQHWGQAAHYYRSYLEKYPHEVKVRAQLAEVLSYDPETLGESTRQLSAALQDRDEPRQRLKLAALLLEEAQALSEAKKPGAREEAGRKRAEAETELQKFRDQPTEPELRREAARLYLWLGDLDRALEYYELYLTQNPADRQGQMEKARVLIYLQRGREAMDVLRRVSSPKAPASTPPSGPAQGHETSSPTEEAVSATEVKTPRVDGGMDREMLVLSLEAALAVKDWGQADQGALKLYSLQLSDKSRLPRDWPEAIRRLRQEKTPQPLSLEERTWIARTWCRQPDLEQHQELVREAVSLAVDNLRTQGILQSAQRRTYQANLLLLAYLLPRLTHYDDLQAMVNRLPGIREDSPEYIASLSYFSEKLGRQGGKLDYLLHVLKERRHHHAPRQPADLVHLAVLAAELGDQPSALHYYQQALQIRPQDQRLQAMRMQILMVRQDWGNLLKTLESGPPTPATALAMAKIYVQRQQYEGAVAILSPRLQDHPAQPEAMLLLAQSYRGLGDNQQALQTLARLESPGQTPEAVLMAKAQVLEAMDDRAGSQTAYEQVIQQAPDAPTAKVAQARLDRSRGNWAAAYQHLSQALAHAPQDIELLNELEYLRSQMRPHREARNLPYWRGERRPEEKFRPWQFGRYDREPAGLGGSRAYPEALLPVQLPYAFRPETTVFSDSNNLRGLETRLSGGFWLGKKLPVNLAVEYRQYQQQNTFFSGPTYNLGLARVFSQSNYVASRLRRAEISLGAGPLSWGDRVKISGEIIGRRYWKEVKRRIGQQGQVDLPVLTGDFHNQEVHSIDYTYQSQGFNAKARGRGTEKDQANRLLGSMSLDVRAGPSTDVSLKYSRRDLFDQDSSIYPRLYQSVLNLAQVRFTTLNQLDLSYNHQFKPGLDWRGSLGGSLYSDQNQRLTFYQGLRWQAVNQPRMHLDLTPHYYLATYSQRRQAYFSPRDYQAIGLGVDFDRQLFRLPTLVLQGTVQMVDNQGRWGPALQGVIGLEQELLQNFFTGVHFFYFREFVDNYRLTSVSVGLRWLF